MRATLTAGSGSSPTPSPSADTHLDRALLTAHDLGRSFVRTAVHKLVVAATN